MRRRARGGRTRWRSGWACRCRAAGPAPPFCPTRRNASSTISPTSSNICGMPLHLHAGHTRVNAHEPSETRARSHDARSHAPVPDIPSPIVRACLPREKRALGNALGLTQDRHQSHHLPPGKESSMRHWHTHEEEFIFVLSGEVVLVTDARRADAAGGHVRGISARNRRRSPARQSRYGAGGLSRDQQSPSRGQGASTRTWTCMYHGAGAAVMFTRKDGSTF